MKIKVIKPERTISETKEMTLDIDGKEVIIRRYEDDNKGEVFAYIDREDWENSDDEELKKVIYNCAYAIREKEFFGSEGIEIDSNDVDQYLNG